ncbi:MAG: hypothetical protein RBR71_09920 [Gudongella sp.]|nr:hypothetical protein [Gudongella sp.]
MNKKLIILIILVLSILALSGCNKSITYSDKFEGIPIYPKMELTASSEYEEHYEVFDFKDTYEDVKEFYMGNIDQEKWEIEENPLYPNIDGEGIKTQGYMLKGKEQEVSLIIGLQNTANAGNILRIDLNGKPFKEGKYNVQGESENWQVSLEYTIRKGNMSVNGDVVYIGENPPKEVDYEFRIYEIIDENEGSKSSSQEVEGDELENNKFSITSQSDRKDTLEVYREAINRGYIEIKWEEQGEKKTEKTTIEIVD